MTSSLRLLDLASRIALVTGGSSGIGRAVALALAQQGCLVWTLDLQPPHVKSGDDAAGVHNDLKITHVRCDVSRSSDVDAAVSFVASSVGGKLDYLVNVAGIDPKYSLEEGDEAAWSRVVDTNLRSSYLITRRAVPMLERGAGRAIVNVSSLSAFLGVKRRSIYAASKAGVLGLTTGLARELGEKEIRINSVCPGWVHCRVLHWRQCAREYCVFGQCSKLARQAHHSRGGCGADSLLAIRRECGHHRHKYYGRRGVAASVATTSLGPWPVSTEPPPASTRGEGRGGCKPHGQHT